MHQRRQFLAEHAIGGVGDDEMERHVDIALAVGLLVIVGDDLAQRLALLLHGEGQHHGVAAERGRAGGGSEVVGHHDVGPGGLRDMDVAVDAARQHQLAGGVDDLARAAEIVAEGGDPPRRNSDVAGEGVGGGRNGAAADDGIEIHALFPLTPFLRGAREYATVTAARWSRPVGRGPERLPWVCR